ncbi:type II toxin-antitoxin system RelE/ParE family toxin [Sorangium sp. So ce295]|uniref:type II toxin-antitoxin system RelE/ParE family toxin n=1 Tax=Sorangium sp. So ce295 TaxID=3133295 RepID=UPI003F5ED8A0
MKAHYHREAREELTAAAEWYEARQPGLGLDFVAEVARAVASIREHPEAWPRWQGLTTSVPIRMFVLQRFPFSLPYLVHDKTLVVLAIAHGQRRPGYWRAGLRSLEAP